MFRFFWILPWKNFRGLGLQALELIKFHRNYVFEMIHHPVAYVFLRFLRREKKS